MSVSKDLFLFIIQDPEVQSIMDDLDIPPERADLFDILDADGSGDLEVTELVQGLLKVRGEARKSDAVASLLAVRATQDMVRQFQYEFQMQQGRTERILEDLLDLQTKGAGIPDAS